MPVMTLNLALLLVFGLSSIQFLFRNGQNLFHSIAKFYGRFLNLVNRSRHVARYALSRSEAIKQMAAK